MKDIVYFAKTIPRYKDQEKTFGIKLDDRKKHMYIIGKTGMGKSYFARRLAVGLSEDSKLIVFSDNEEDIEEFSPFLDIAQVNLWSSNYDNWNVWRNKLDHVIIPLLDTFNWI